MVNKPGNEPTDSTGKVTDPLPKKPDEPDLGELKAEIEEETFVDPQPVTSAEVLAAERIAPLSDEQRILHAVETIRQQLSPAASKAIQEDVARLVSLLEPLQLASHTKTRLAEAELALHWLIGSTRWQEAHSSFQEAVPASVSGRVVSAESSDRVVLAKRLTEDLDKKLGGRFMRRWHRFRDATPPHVDVVLGLGVATVLLGGALILFAGNPVDAISPDQEGSNALVKALIWLGAVGAFGSIVSILIRLRDIAAEVQEVSKVFLFFMTGLFKPVIGFASADLAYVLIKSQLIPLNFEADAAVYAFVGVAFVAGFSERLVKDLVSATERAVGAAAERGVEAQKVAKEKEEQIQREVIADLDGDTVISKAQIYGDVDLADPDEAVTVLRVKTHDTETGRKTSAPPTSD